MTLIEAQQRLCQSSYGNWHRPLPFPIVQFFYPDALNARPSSQEKAVCLSVCPSVKRVDCDKTEERSVQICIPSEKSFSLYFSEKKNSWWGRASSEG